MSDERVVREAKAGSAAAVSELFDSNWAGVWRAAYAVTLDRELANDAAQDAFLRVIESIQAFDETRPFAPWVRKIAVNRAIDLIRHEARSASRGDAGPSPHEDSIGDRELREAVRGLSVDRRAVVVLHYWLGLRLGEISEVLDVPEGTVASRLGRALSELRAELKEESCLTSM